MKNTQSKRGDAIPDQINLADHSPLPEEYHRVLRSVVLSQKLARQPFGKQEKEATGSLLWWPILVGTPCSIPSKANSLFPDLAEAVYLFSVRD